MVLSTFTEAVGFVLAGKRVFAHAGNGEHPDLDIKDNVLRLGGRPLAPQDVFLTYESEEDPSWMIAQVLHELMRGCPDVFEVVGGPTKATAYISHEEGDTIHVTITTQKGRSTPLTALWKRIPQTKDQ